MLNQPGAQVARSLCAGMDARPRAHLLTSIPLQVEKELTDICASILQLLDEHLIPTASTGESKVFYLKMKGDYHRYLAEFKTGADRKEAAEHTLLAYKAAQVAEVATRTGAGSEGGGGAFMQQRCVVLQILGSPMSQAQALDWLVAAASAWLHGAP